MPKPKPETVWFDFGDGPEEHSEASLDEINAFIRGVQFATENCGIDDYRQFNTQEEVDSHLRGDEDEDDDEDDKEDTDLEDDN